MNLTYYSVSETDIMCCSAHCDTVQMLAVWIFSALTQEPKEMIMVHQTETIGTAGSIQKSFSGPEVHMKVLSMHADSSSPSAAAKYLDKRSESSMSAMMSESMVSMSSSSQTKKISVFSHTEASSSLETLSSELKKGETHSCENNVLLHPQ